jgi:hypothetical protein
MTDCIDPIDILYTRPPGSCLFARVQLDAGTWELAWFLREESARIATLDRPEIEFRAGIATQRVQGQDILVMPIVVRVGPEYAENLYEAWFNAWADEGKGLLDLTTLADQARLTLHFYGDAGQRERSLVASNQLKAFAAETIRLVAGGDPWSMHAFDRARAQVEAHHPSVWALWQSLTSMK